MEGKSVLVTRILNTLIHEWNVRAFHCTMDRLDDGDTHKIIFYSRAQQPTVGMLLLFEYLLWIVSSFLIFCVKFKWLAGCV